MNNKISFPFRMQPHLREAILEASEYLGISMNSFISLAATSMAEEVLRKGIKNGHNNRKSNTNGKRRSKGVRRR